MPKHERIVFEWQQSRSESSRAAWEAKYERAYARGEEHTLGPKGQAYIEQKYGPVDVEYDEPDYEDRDYGLDDEEDSP